MKLTVSLFGYKFEGVIPVTDRCLGEQYSEALPSASVVICVQDPEAWSTLVRTVRSVLHTAPDEHLREILLVDDFRKHGEFELRSSVAGPYLPAANTSIWASWVSSGAWGLLMGFLTLAHLG